MCRELRVMGRGEMRWLGKESASSFYRHKEGRSTCTGRSKVVVFSPNQGWQWVTTVESTLWGTEDHGAGHGGCPGRRPDLAEIAPAFWQLLRVAWWLL